MIRPICFLVLLIFPLVTYSYNCFTCGIFLSSPEPQCKGIVNNHTCSNANYGCLSIVGKNQDSTYYVEKRCAEKTDNLTEGCIETTVRDNKTRVQQCLCKSDLCNSTSSFSISLCFAFIVTVLFWKN